MEAFCFVSIGKSLGSKGGLIGKNVAMPMVRVCSVELFAIPARRQLILTFCF